MALTLTRGANWTLPVAALDGHYVGDSTAIIAALEERCPGRPLYPADPVERRRALELEEWFDEQLGPYVRRFSLHVMRGDREPFDELASRQLPKALRRYRHLAGAYGRAYTGARFQTVADSRSDVAREQILVALDRLESELGAGGYLVGERLTVADLTATSMFCLIVLPPEGPLDLDPLPALLAELRASVASRPGHQWVLEMFRASPPPDAQRAAAVRLAAALWLPRSSDLMHRPGAGAGASPRQAPGPPSDSSDHEDDDEGDVDVGGDVEEEDVGASTILSHVAPAPVMLRTASCTTAPVVSAEVSQV